MSRISKISNEVKHGDNLKVMKVTRVINQLPVWSSTSIGIAEAVAAAATTAVTFAAATAAVASKWPSPEVLGLEVAGFSAGFAVPCEFFYSAKKEENNYENFVDVMVIEDNDRSRLHYR